MEINEAVERLVHVVTEKRYEAYTGSTLAVV
jgi:hypothetical protein